MEPRPQPANPYVDFPCAAGFSASARATPALRMKAVTTHSARRIHSLPFKWKSPSAGRGRHATPSSRRSHFTAKLKAQVGDVRLKGEVPGGTGRDRRATDASLQRRRLHPDEMRLPHRRTVDPVGRLRPPLARGPRERERTVLPRALQRRHDHSNVPQALLAIRLHVGALEDGLREGDELRGELIGGLELPYLLLAADREAQLALSGELVPVHQLDVALGPHQAVLVLLVCAEADGELPGPLTGELQLDGHPFMDVLEPLVFAAVHTHGEHLDRVGPAQVARGVDAVRSQVPDGAAAAAGRGADVTGPDLELDMA